jgi:hypothetical protein
MRTEPAHGLDPRLGNAWMPAEAQIVLGREVDAFARGRRVMSETVVCGPVGFSRARE